MASTHHYLPLIRVCCIRYTRQAQSGQRADTIELSIPTLACHIETRIVKEEIQVEKFRRDEESVSRAEIFRLGTHRKIWATSHPELLQRKQRHPHHTAIMGRLHSNGKGISSSAIPYSRTAPAWLKTTPDAVEDQICKLAKKGATPSQIGVVLRDSHGIAQVKIVTGISSYFAG